MKIQLNNSLIDYLPSTAIVATGVGDIEIENLPENPFDYDYVNGQLIRIRWSDWHEHTNFQIKFTADDLLDLLEEVPALVEYTKTLTTYRDMMFRYFYVNFFNDMERELIEYYGGIVTERSEL